MDQMFYPAQLTGCVQAPASKSEAHRRMICAGLSPEDTTLTGFMDSDDMAATRRCLAALGAKSTLKDDVLTMHGGVHVGKGLPVLDCGESGSTLRFFVPIALSTAGGAVFRMHGRLGKRPMEVYQDLFVPKGVSWRMGIGADGATELHVHGRMVPGHYALPGHVSSQFVSGLLFALPLLPGDSTLTVLPPVESASYINMTLEALAQSGIVYHEVAPYTWQIPGNQVYHAAGGRLSGDYSQAAVFLCAGAMGHPVSVTGLSAQTTQGDRAILRHLRALGAEVTEDDDRITVRGGSLGGAVLDMRDCPDIAPILALTCLFAKGESRLTGCGRLRLKECDRLQATADLLTRLGGHARVEGDDLVLQGGIPLRGGVTLPDFNDHRMVMLGAMAATLCQEPVTISGTEALSKSWPDFLQVYHSLGGRVE